MSRAPRPSDFVEPNELEARVERQWTALERAGLPAGAASARKPRRPLGLALALAAGAAALCVWWIGAVRTSPRTAKGAVVESVERAIAVKLEDGSQLELAERTQLLLLRNEPDAIELSLRTGRAHFTVTHRRGRGFSVQAGACEVRVIGTRFVLEQRAHGAGHEVRVEVEEGVVEVRRHDIASGEVRRLHAGESWSAVIAPASAKPVTGPASVASSNALVPAPAPNAQPGPDEMPMAAASANGSNARPRRSEREPRRAVETQAEAPARPPAMTEKPLDAAGLFKRATLARRVGRMRDAADDYAALLARFPRDARAGLSAFELGRIRMDALGDEAGAIEALARAAAGPSRTSFHEDALARIVLANDALGRHQSCVDARTRYLSSYPHGVHSRTLNCK